MNTDSFRSWFALAKPGDSVAYYCGYLARARMVLPELDRVARLAMWASDQGLVQLTQKRIGDERYQYIARRTGKRMWQ